MKTERNFYKRLLLVSVNNHSKAQRNRLRKSWDISLFYFCWKVHNFLFLVLDVTTEKNFCKRLVFVNVNYRTKIQGNRIRKSWDINMFWFCWKIHNFIFLVLDVMAEKNFCKRLAFVSVNHRTQAQGNRIRKTWDISLF